MSNERRCGITPKISRARYDWPTKTKATGTMKELFLWTYDQLTNHFSTGVLILLEHEFTYKLHYSNYNYSILTITVHETWPFIKE